MTDIAKLRERVGEIREGLKSCGWFEQCGECNACEKRILLALIDHLEAEIARLEGEVHERDWGTCWERDNSAPKGRVARPDACPVCRRLIGGAS